MKLRTESQIPPQLIEQVPLPAFTANGKSLELDLKLLISTDGSVRQVEFQQPTGNEEWETLATQKILNWKFSPALVNNTPIQAWVDQTVIIQFRDPVYLNLAAILCDNREQAEGIYTKLLAGENFIALSRDVSTPPSSEPSVKPGLVDIRRYPENIQTALVELKLEKFTRPLSLGRSYIIFKRLSDPPPSEEKKGLLM